MNSMLKITVGEHYVLNDSEYEVVKVSANYAYLRSLINGTILRTSPAELSGAWELGHLRKTQATPSAAEARRLRLLIARQIARVEQCRWYMMRGLQYCNKGPSEALAAHMVTKIVADSGAGVLSNTSIFAWQSGYLTGRGLGLASKQRSSLRHFDRQPDEIRQLIRMRFEQLHLTATSCSQTKLIAAIQHDVGVCNLARDSQHQLPIPTAHTLHRILHELRGLAMLSFLKASRRC